MWMTLISPLTSQSPIIVLVFPPLSPSPPLPLSPSCCINNTSGGELYYYNSYTRVFEDVHHQVGSAVMHLGSLPQYYLPLFSSPFLSSSSLRLFSSPFLFSFLTYFLQWCSSIVSRRKVQFGHVVQKSR